MRFAWLVVLVAMSTSAAAAPVAEGYQLELDQYQLWVAKGGRRAPLGGYGSATLDELQVNRTARSVGIPLLTDCGGDQVITFSFDQLEARLVNAESLARHRKKDWAAAAKGFAVAAKLDPIWRLPAYNLASARAQLGDLSGGAAALAPWLASEPVTTYVQVTLDPELAPLLATPALAAVRAATPGKVTVTAAGLAGRYAYAADRGLIAAQIDESNGMSCDTVIGIALIDARRGVEVARLALSGFDHCSGTPAVASPGVPDRAAMVQRLLVELGVTTTPFEQADAVSKGDDAEKRVVRLPASRLGVVTSGNGISILRQDTQLASGAIREPRMTWAAFLSVPRVMLLGSYRPSDSCPSNGLDVIRVPKPE